METVWLKRLKEKLWVCRIKTIALDHMVFDFGTMSQMNITSKNTITMVFDFFFFLFLVKKLENNLSYFWPKKEGIRVFR